MERPARPYRGGFSGFSMVLLRTAAGFSPPLVCSAASRPTCSSCTHHRDPLMERGPTLGWSRPNEDTEWNDILRKKGILPPKEVPNNDEEEEELARQQRSIVKTYEDMSLEDLDENEDEFGEEDEAAIEMYRQKRLSEWKATQLKNVFGEVVEISGLDYIKEVNKAGEDIWVVLHLYKQGKFPQTKFLKSISTTCIANYPDRNLPTIFVYREGDMKAQFIGPLVFGGMSLKVEELEWRLSESGAVKTELEENPRKEIEDKLMSSIRSSLPSRKDSDSEDEDY
ncbi:hypothetical protein F7725_002445 [Dissostichus mawsoni]|uniref:Phosducin-like protein 3 n=1 Tax=Dissostichus mawsoni TaxID=36200 RepID=A0A7J5Y2D9_DISMA|nr:hypothetical protein F7725_002445 [Dissostichus mawsoni]